MNRRDFFRKSTMAAVGVAVGVSIATEILAESTVELAPAIVGRDIDAEIIQLIADAMRRDMFHVCYFGGDAMPLKTNLKTLVS